MVSLSKKNLNFRHYLYFVYEDEQKYGDQGWLGVLGQGRNKCLYSVKSIKPFIHDKAFYPLVHISLRASPVSHRLY